MKKTEKCKGKINNRDTFSYKNKPEKQKSHKNWLLLYSFERNYLLSSFRHFLQEKSAMAVPD